MADDIKQAVIQAIEEDVSWGIDLGDFFALNPTAEHRLKQAIGEAVARKLSSVSVPEKTP